MNMMFSPAISRRNGKIWLVGAGPGDPELLTVRAARLITQARLIIHDGLVAPAILAMAPVGARMISVAKQRGRHTMPQHEINTLLITEAMAGHDVLRLKGGDPFIFGRGGEEVDAARTAGLEVEIVPGISAGIGAAAAAQLPLTHREAASVVSFVTGQCTGSAGLDWVGPSWADLAGPGRTLVIYMGLTNVDVITRKLMHDGLDPATPTAVVENATRPDMRVIKAPLSALAAQARQQTVTSPAIIIIGAIAAWGEHPHPPIDETLELYEDGAMRALALRAMREVKA